MSTSAAVFLPVVVPSVSNLREHWRTRAARAKQHRAWAHTMLRGSKEVRALGGTVNRVTLTRVASRMLDSDNNITALKAVRDGVADYLGIDDGSAAVEWVYAARKSSRKLTGVEIRLECPQTALDGLRSADQGAEVSDKVPDSVA